MRLNRYVKGCFLTVGCFLAMSGVAHAWEAYAHWLVGNPQGLGLRANLPDYWGQSWAWDACPPGIEIIPLFPWTHGCLRTGWHLEPPPLPCPPVPLFQVPDEPTMYRVAFAVAEDDMYNLVSKMSCAHQQELNASQMVDTARGFLIHNEFDAFGHFTLFKAGTGEKWVEHTLLEKYADFRLIDQPSGTLYSQGEIRVSIGMQGHAGIILLSQKCFRKNRHTIDVAVPAGLEPESLQQTNNRLNQEAQKLSPKIFEYDKFLAIKAALLLRGWTASELDQWWQTQSASLPQSASQAAGALGAMPEVGPSGCLP